MAAAALRMPSHYVPVEAEEMEYVEGGGIREIVEGALGSLIATAKAVKSVFRADIWQRRKRPRYGLRQVKKQAPTFCERLLFDI